MTGFFRSDNFTKQENWANLINQISKLLDSSITTSVIQFNLQNKLWKKRSIISNHDKKTKALAPWEVKRWTSFGNGLVPSWVNRQKSGSSLVCALIGQVENYTQITSRPVSFCVFNLSNVLPVCNYWLITGPKRQIPNPPFKPSHKGLGSCQATFLPVI